MSIPEFEMTLGDLFEQILGDYIDGHLKINNEHFLNYLLFNIARHGFKKIIIVAGYQGKLFKKFHKKYGLTKKSNYFFSQY